MQGCGCGLINETDQPQTPPMQQEPGIAVVACSDRIVHTDRVQTYDEEPAPARPRPPLANWSSVKI